MKANCFPRILFVAAILLIAWKLNMKAQEQENGQVPEPPNEQKMAVESPEAIAPSSDLGESSGGEEPPAGQKSPLDEILENPLPIKDEDEPGEGDAPLLPGREEGGGHGVIQGTVFNDKGTAGHPNANVSVVGLGLFTSTDENGSFRIENVPAGFHRLKVLKSGFRQKIEQVEVSVGETANVEVFIEERPIEVLEEEYVGEDFDVVEEYIEEERQDLFLGEDETPSLVGGLGKAEFSQAGVSDAGDAVSKVSGANIVGGQFAVVRGLGDRYSNTTTNGALIPSADPSRKAVQLDLFPADLLQSVKIYKALRPDLPGEFTGGLVEIQTLRFPEERILEASAGIKYNPEYGEASEYRGFRGDRLNFFGDNLKNPLEQFYRTRGFPRNLSDAFFNGGGSISSKKTKSHPFGQSFSVLFGDKYQLGMEGELGVILSFTQESKDTYRHRTRARAAGGNVRLTPETFAQALPGRFEPLGVLENGEIIGVGTELVASDDIYSQSVDWGALANIGWKVNDRHSLNLTYFRNHSAETRVARSTDLEQEDVNAAQIEDVITGDFQVGGLDFNFFSEVLDQNIRDLEIIQVGGKHHLLMILDRDVTLDWIASYTNAIEERPGTVDLITGYYRELEGSEHGPVSTAQGGGNAQSPTINSTLSEEEAAYLRADVTVPLLGGKEEGDDFLNFKFGASSFEKTREASGYRTFIRFPIDEGEIENNPENGSIIGEIVIGDDPTQPRPEDLGLRDGPTVGLSPATSSGSLTFNADGQTDLMSYYLMLAGRYNDWEFYGGARLEKEVRSYSVDIDGNNSTIRRRDDAIGSQENTDILPSLSFTKILGYDGAHRVNLSWSQSIARPVFYEFAPIENFDPVAGQVRQGNPNLEDALATNYDLSWTWTPDPSARISAALFYKDIENPIVQITRNDRLTWENFPSASVTGIELELYKKWDNGLSLTANGSYIEATLDPFTETVGNITRVFEIGALPGQADYLANVILAYTNDDWGFNASLVYNFTDSYTLFALDKFSADPSLPPRRGNVVSAPRHTFDIVLGKTFSVFDEDDTKVSFKVKNIFNAPIEFEYEGNDGILPYEKYDPGPEFSLSASMKF